MPRSLRTRFTNRATWVLQLAVALALGMSIGKWLGATYVPWPPVLLGLVFLLTIAVHEAGHWLGCRYAGLRCYAVAVLWLHLERGAAGWRCRVGPRRAGSLGHVRALPAGASNLSRQMVCFVAGGPVASVGAGLLALALGGWLRQQFPGPSLLAGYFAAEASWVFGVGSLATGVLNAIPFTTRYGNVSDCERLRRLRRPSPETTRELALLRLSGHSHLGVRPRAWDAALVAQLLETPTQSAHYCAAQALAYTYQLDRADLAAARQHLAAACAARQAATPALRRQLCAEAACLALLHDNQPEAATEWLHAARAVKLSTKRPSENDDFMLALAACNARDWLAAWQHLQHCTQALAKTPDAGARAMGFDRLRQLQTLVEQRAASAGKATLARA